MSEVGNKIEVSFEPGKCEILGVFGDFLHIKGEVFNDETEGLDECILLIPKEEYLRTLNIWIKGKREYCEEYGEYCGVMGYITSKEAEYVNGDYKTYKWNSKSEDVDIISRKGYLVNKFQDYCDFEHG